MKYTGPQTMIETGPAAFGPDDPKRQAEILAYQARKAQALSEVQSQAPALVQSVVEKPQVDLSQLPPPHPSDRMPS